MATIVTRSGKGSPLTNNEADANFNNLNSGKAELSGATFTGAITANAGVVVDNFTLNGTTLALSSGDMTLDSAGDIILDADGADFKFRDGGAGFFTISNSSLDTVLKVEQSNEDFIVKGNDGGSIITALTLDMSAAGAATFASTISSGAITSSGNIFMSTNGSLLRNSGGALQLQSDSSSVVLRSNNATALTLDTSQNATFAGTITANAGVVVDNFTIDGTTIALTSGDFTLDVAGEIELDADGGKWIFKDGGVQIGRIENTSSDFIIKSSVNNKDIKFNGEDGDNNITALTLDMSASGRATFNNNVVVTDNNSLIAGSGDDLQIFYNGTNGEIDVSSGNLTLDVAGDIVLDADGGDIQFKDGGTLVGALDLTGGFAIKSSVSNADFFIQGNDGGSAINALILDMSAAGAASFNNKVTAGGVYISNMVGGQSSLQLEVGGANKAIVGLEPSVGGGSANDLSIYSRSGALRFWASGAQKMTLDASGNLIVSGTAAGQPTSVALHNTGYVHAVSSHQMAGIFDRRDSNGDILLLRKQGATAGSIGVVGVQPYFAGPNAATGGIRLDSTGSNGVVTPTTNTGANRDAATDLGYSSGGTNIRFRDLYLSGGVFLGGTGAANKLSDFETGTWTPTWTPASGSGQTIAAASGHYTKVGNRVFIDIHLATNGHGSASGNLTLGGLPFTQANNSGQNASLSCGQAANAGLVAGQACTARINQTATTITPLVWSATTGTTTMTVAQWGASGTWRFTGSYAV